MQYFRCSTTNNFHPLLNFQWFTRFQTAKQLERFLEEINPKNFTFPGCSIEFCWYALFLENYKNFQNLMFQLLTRFGDKILYLRFSERRFLCPDFQQRLFQNLQLVPNLRRLYLDLQFSENISANRWDQFPLQFANYQLPALPDLQSLEIAHCQDDDHRLFEYYRCCLQHDLRPLFGQLTKLQLSGGALGIDCSVNGRCLELPKLRELEFQLEYPKHLQFLGHVTTAARGTLKELKVLIASDTVSWPNNRTTLSKILGKVLPAENCLEILKIFCTVPLSTRVCDSTEDSRLYYSPLGSLHVLKSLSVLKCLLLHGFSFSQMCIIDTLPLSLEFLLLECKRNNNAPKGYGQFSNFPADLCYGADNYYNYELWETLPKLKCVSLKTLRRERNSDNNLDSEKCSDVQVYWRETAQWKQELLRLQIQDNMSKECRCSIL